MKAFSLDRLFLCLFLLLSFSGANPLLAGDLIPPSRMQGTTAEPHCTLVVFSEPPKLEVYLDGAHLGQTPLWGAKATPGLHKIRVDNTESDIILTPGKRLKIGLLRGEFITLPEQEKPVAAVPSPPATKTAEGHPKKPAPETEKDRDIASWQTFITHGHF